MSEETNNEVEFEEDVEGIEEESVEEVNGSDESGVPELSDEELDEVADTAISILQDILKYFNVGEVTIDEYEGDEGELILDITGDDLAVLIGRHGKTLDSLQFLVSAVTVRKWVSDILLSLMSRDIRVDSARNSSLSRVRRRTVQPVRTAVSSCVP